MQINDTTLLTATYEQKLYEIDVARAEIDNPNGIDLPGHVVANPVLTDNFLYVPLSEGGVIALDPTDYSEIWGFLPDNAKGIYSSPLLIEGTLYVSEMNHHLYALDAQTGAVKWDDDLEGAVASTPDLRQRCALRRQFCEQALQGELGRHDRRRVHDNSVDLGRSGGCG